ncbi:MAG: hypothetical protein DHS20C21_10450 [Gemmatimonadota bacterium]|nr:MAG: hypothetical protein DHS20C21_10450 [Gemmatimonadota bacterium]
MMLLNLSRTGAAVRPLARLLLLLPVISTPAASQWTGATGVVLQPGPEGKDTCWGTVYAKDGQPDAETLYHGGWGDWYYDYFEFDLAALPRDVEAARVEFQVFTTSFRPNDPAFEVHRILEPWTEAGCSFYDHPASVRETRMSPLVDGWNTVDITRLYRAWTDGTYPNYGLRLVPTRNNETNGSFASSDHADPSLRPRIIVYPGLSPTESTWRGKGAGGGAGEHNSASSPTTWTRIKASYSR